MKLLTSVLNFLEGKPRQPTLRPRRSKSCEMVFDIDCYIDDHRDDKVDVLHKSGGDIVAVVTESKPSGRSDKLRI
ncbi:MAG: hypothetical protein HRU19_16250 [Pseudobacteriovorax sp.]|nr:hypothetical protein [Pseudobacteriovorax sp.]